MANKVKNDKERKPVVVPPHLQVPYSPGNIKLTKAEFIAQRKREKEKAIKIAEFTKGLEKEEKTKEKK